MFHCIGSTSETEVHYGRLLRREAVWYGKWNGTRDLARARSHSPRSPVPPGSFYLRLRGRHFEPSSSMYLTITIQAANLNLRHKVMYVPTHYDQKNVNIISTYIR